jgi:HK97 gp10 family phage protein
MARVTIEGLDELRKQLVDAEKAIRAGLRDAVQESIDAIRNDARRDVPVDTGKLRDSIEAAPGPSGLSGIVGTFGVHYAPFVEHGTSKRPARPFMLPAAERERRRLPDRISDAVEAKLR